MNRIIKLIKSNISQRQCENVKVSPLAFLDVKSKLEPFTYIDRFCVLHNTTVDSYSYIGYGSKLNNVQIGRYCSIASDVKIGLGKHPTNKLSTSPIFYTNLNPFNIDLKDKLNFNIENKHTIVGDDVWIGANAIIMDGLTIGNGAIIAAGSVVTRDIEEYSIVAGVPARPMRKRFSDETITLLKHSKWWEKNPDEVMSLEIYKRFLVGEL